MELLMLRKDYECDLVNECDIVFDHKISLNSANIRLISSVTLLALGWYSILKFL